MNEEDNVVESSEINSPNKKLTSKKKGKVKKKKKTATNRKASSKRPFPKETVLTALKIAQKIKELNGGKPWDPKEIGKAVEIGPGTPKFYYLTAASRDYELTIGSSKTEKIEITELGKEILYAQINKPKKKKK